MAGNLFNRFILRTSCLSCMVTWGGQLSVIATRYGEQQQQKESLAQVTH